MKILNVVGDGPIPKLWDDHVAQRIVSILLKQDQ